jgi:glutamate transport system substrate-binding protein
MYRRLMILATGLALLAAVAGCGDSSTSTTGEGGGRGAPELPAGSTAKAIQDKGKLVVGTKFDQPGFGLKSLSDQPEGFDVEVGKLIGKAIFGDDIEGKVEFVEAQSRVREEFIEQGKVDLVVATYSITDARKQRVGFAGPYLVAGQSLLVKKADNSITGPETLKGKKVCSVRGSTPLERIQKQAPEADYSLLFDAYADCVEALKDGRIDAVTTDDQILLGYAADNPEELKVVGKPFSQELYGVGVKKDDTAFRMWVNDQLQAMFGNGSWGKAYADTIGSKTGASVPPAPSLDRY